MSTGRALKESWDRLPACQAVLPICQWRITMVQDANPGDGVMVTITMKLPESLATRLEQEVRRRHTTKSEFLRQCVERELAGSSSEGSPSFHQLARDKCGGMRGPCDLATNPKYLAGFGE